MIRRTVARVCVLCAFAMILASGVRAAPATVDDLLKDMPSNDAATASAVFDRALKGGADTIKALCSRLIPPGTGDDTNVRYLLSGLSFHVARPGAAAERTLFERAVIESLGGASNREIKAFLLRLLQWPGGDEAASRIGAHLKDPSLCEAAAFALQYIGGPAAEEALLEALDSATDGAAGTIVKALGVFRSRRAARGIERWIKAEDADLRRGALHALAQIGDPGSRSILAARTKQGGLLDRSDAVANYLLFARRLDEDGRGREAMSVCRELLVKDAPSSVRCAAMVGLTSVSPRHALPDLLAALDDKRPDVRDVASRQLGSIYGHMVTRRVLNRLKGAPVSRRVVIVGILARRRDSASVRACVKALADDASKVRLAAVEACATLGTKEALYALLGLLASKDAPVAKAAQNALARMRAPGVDATITSGLATATPEGKAAAAMILAKRRATAQAGAMLALTSDDARAVRAAALDAMRILAGKPEVPALVEIAFKAKSSSDRKAAAKALGSVATRLANPKECIDVVLKSMADAGPDARPAGYAILTALGGEKALAVVVKAAKSGSAEERAAAVRALAKWGDGSALEPLVAMAEDEAALAQKVLLLRGAVRLVKESDIDASEKVGFCERLLEAAPRLEERKLVISGLAGVRHVLALKRVLDLLESRDVASESAVAAARIATPSKGKTVARPPHADGLRKAAVLVKGDLRSGIEAALRTLPSTDSVDVAKPDAEGFEPLFNGRDLAGWIGDTKGYVAEDGKLVCKPGGKLFTERQYSDFVLRFEFKLTPGANNGLGIRTPSRGDPAYAGMELQILDDTSPKYAKLQPYQYHGSIYGIVASKRGHQKPVGEWNVQEVTADGPKIRVVLNGATIVDADLSTIKQTKEMHNLGKHPGLRNESGHIGFLGHGSVVEFRNISLKDLTGGIRKPPEGFTVLFNGKDLTGWKGLVGGDPNKRAKLSADELAKRQAKADADMRAHWRVEDATLVFDGKGHSLCTAKNYGDFEMYVDWKIGRGGDSGIYLRGAPQVQIWDPAKWPVGSGGLYNNKKNPSKPLVCADNPVGEWNTFRIKMVGERVTVHLNDRLVVDNVVLENYWDRSKPILPEEQIELQSHGSTLYFRNVFIREIPRGEK
ncbi:MAG: family 16 glycoside hydrolase [Planctomycetota bacterium]|jgi:HEAT repeat protein